MEVVNNCNKTVFHYQDGRLSKRLCYILRYGALKEGLHVDDSGFMSLDELISVPLLKSHSRQEIIEELETSLSGRNTKRFEIKKVNEKTLVRAAFGRKFEKNPCHEDSKVYTLFEICITTVIRNLQDYDLHDFPDEFIISSMIHRLKRQKKLNNSILKHLFVPTLEHIDLEGLYLTENILKNLCSQCPNIRSLSLRDCGYIMTDNLMEQLLKKLKHLESLNISLCQYLTDQSLRAVRKNCTNLKHLNISMIKGISDTAIVEFVEACPSLKHVDMYQFLLKMRRGWHVWLYQEE